MAVSEGIHLNQRTNDESIGVPWEALSVRFT